MAHTKKVTVVNDHPEFLALLADFLGDEGYEVLTIPKHQGAFEQIKNSNPDVIILDLIFDNVPAGWALLDMLYLDPTTRSIPVILTSAGTLQVRDAVSKFADKGIYWLEKPFELESLLNLIKYLNSSAYISFPLSNEHK